MFDPNDFPTLKEKIHGHPLAYLDNAATTLRPLCLIQRMNKYYHHENSNIHRGVHYLSVKATDNYEQARKAVQKFINAPSDKEIIFTKGTTESINLVASAWGEQNLKPGDIILLSTMEHHSNIVPWQMVAAKTQSVIQEIPITDNGEIDLNAFKKLLGPKVKMVSICHASNALGTVNPLDQLIPLTHEAGALFCVDAAQSAPHDIVDVQKLDCDFLAFSAHKMYGPHGLGILYGKECWLDQMPPYQGGGGMIEEVDLQKTTYAALPGKFEAGTPPIAEAIGFYETLEYLKKIGWDFIKQSENKLFDLAIKELSRIQGLKIIGSTPRQVPVISFILEGIHNQDLGILLDQQGVAIRTGHHCTWPLMKRLSLTGTARASISFYNTDRDIEQLISSIEKSRKFLI